MTERAAGGFGYELAGLGFVGVCVFATVVAVVAMAFGVVGLGTLDLDEALAADFLATAAGVVEVWGVG